MEIGKFEFHLTTQNSFALPDFKGSTFRGKFGHVLKRTICIMSHRNCEGCSIHQQCAYPYLFETRNDKQEEVARPFVLEPPLTHKQFFLKGENLYLNLVLLGRALQFLPYFVYVFKQMGGEGIGMDRGKYHLESVRAVALNGEKREIYHHTSEQLSSNFQPIQLDDFKTGLIPQVTLQFLTPTQIKADGRMVTHLEFPTLLKAILRRYRSLRYFHGDGVQERFEIDWEAAEKIEIVAEELQFEKRKRYSNRQKRPVPLHGFTGKITYRGNLAPFYPWLKIGEYLHVGKGATFGLGWYRLG